VYMPIMVILFGINAVIAVGLYLVAPYLAVWVGDAKLDGAYRAAAGIFIVLPFLAGLRSFFQGHEKMFPTAVSQVVEQLVRVGIIIGSAYFIFIGKMDFYAIGKVGVIASVMGMLVALIGWGFFLR